MVNPYTEEFYAAEAVTARAGAGWILPLVFGKHSPQTIVDVGCGSGEWVKAGEALGCRVVGIDGQWCPGATVKHDLDFPLTLATMFDLAICLEVAEHLAPTHGPGLVVDLCRLAPVILWSAAVPGQGGEGHRNEQPERYWERLFNAQGYSADRWIRECIAGNAQVPIWYRNNVMIYERSKQ